MIEKGFSLIELMVVLVVIGVFACFTYPSYLNSLIKARRHDGQVALLDLANRLEQFYSEHHSYEKASIGTGADTDIQDNVSPHGWYRLCIRMKTSRIYRLEAIAMGAQAHDLDCHGLTLDSFGHKGITGGAKDTAVCWS